MGADCFPFGQPRVLSRAGISNFQCFRGRVIYTVVCNFRGHISTIATYIYMSICIDHTNAVNQNSDIYERLWITG